MTVNRDIVVSSRVRLARNIKNLPFGMKFNKLHSDNIALDVYRNIGGERTGFGLYKPSSPESLDGTVLKEKRLISEDLLSKAPLASVILNESETVSIMIGEEDHIRIQSIEPGFNLNKSFIATDKIDNIIAKNIPLSFSEKLGYLTACPTNLGTGLRVSAMMFLPGLSIYNSLEECVQAMSRLNMAIRGVYGEGSDSSGYLYQLSNQRTLGLSEEAILEAVISSVLKIVEAEKQAREVLLNEGGATLKVKIRRALGTLLYAHKIESAEFNTTMALVKLGAYYGFFDILDSNKFEKLFIEAQPASLQSICKKKLSQQDRDIFRAKYVSDVLNSIIQINGV